MLRNFVEYIGLASAWGGQGEAKELDIKKTKFNPNNPNHTNFIDARLHNFTAKRDALQGFDKNLLGYAALGTLVWLSGFTRSWGPYLALAGTVALYMHAKQSGREQLQSDFDAALQEIYDVYHWYCKDQGTAVTHTPTFEKLLSALLPYTLNWENLVFWKLGTLEQNKVSYKVIEMFEASPHTAAVAMLKRDAEPKKESVPSALESIVPKPQDWVYKSNAYQFFAETSANVKLKLLYGHKFENDVQEVPQPRRG